MRTNEHLVAGFNWLIFGLSLVVGYLAGAEYFPILVVVASLALAIANTVLYFHQRVTSISEAIEETFGDEL